jgi:uncharacterized coiled-coil protein SlyX
MNAEDSVRLRTLEERFAFLEKHVAAQDRAMLEMAERIDGVETKLRLLRERMADPGDSGGPGAVPDERPPHY